MKSFLKLLQRRVLVRNYIDAWYVLLLALATTSGTVVWLAAIDPSKMGEAAWAVTIALVAPLPIYFALNVALRKARFTNRQIIFATLMSVAMANLFFIWVFYALSPEVYKSHYLGLFYGWLNQLNAALYVFMGYAFVRGSFLDFKKVRSEYSAVLAEFKAFKSGALARLDQENQVLKDRAQVALMPALKGIQEALAIANEQPLLVAEKIQDTLKYTVRPLGRDLRGVFDDEVLSNEIQAEKIKPWGSIPKLINPRNTFNPTFAAWVWLPVVVASNLVLNNRVSAWVTAIDLVACWLMMSAVRQLLPNRKINSFLSFSLQILAVYLPIRLTSYLNVLWAPAGISANAFLNQVGTLILVASICFTYVAVTEITMYQSGRALEQIKLQLLEAREVVSQKIWVAKRNWSYLVHGSVQAHLLAAQLLASSGKIDDDKVSKIKNHFEALLEILNHPPKPSVDLLQEISDLEATWAGVTSINFEFAPEALVLLENNGSMRFAVNEIAKEAVSNAVKHAQANHVEIRVEIAQGDLVVTAANNGKKPLKEMQRSLGSEMLDELTKDWSLGYDTKTKEVTLLARLALT